MLLLVGTLRSQRPSFPSSLTTLRMYLPSGEIAANAALPESVTLETAMFWNGAAALRLRKA